MTHDPNLVEAVARAIAESEGYDWDSLPDDWSIKGGEEAMVGRNDLRKNARAALAAINASGTHWVAPWEANETMAAAYGGYYDDNWRKGHALEDTSARDAWNDMRAAYLEDGGTADGG